MRDGTGWIEFESSFKFLFGMWPVQVVSPEQCAERGMRLGQRRVNLYCFESGGFCQRKDFVGRAEIVGRQIEVGVRHARIGGRIGWVQADGISEIFDCLRQRVSGILTPEITTLEIGLVGFIVFRVVAGSRLMLRRGCQPFRDIARQLLLQGEDVGHRAPVLLSPELAVIGGVDQFGADHQHVSLPTDSAGDHAADSQVVPNGLGGRRLPLEMKGRIARGNAEVGRLGKRINQAFRYAVAEILEAHITAVVGEREYCYRIEPTAGGSPVQESCDKHGDNDHGCCQQD